MPVNQDTRLCVMRPSLVARDMCVIYTNQLLTIFNCLQHKNYYTDFNQNHVLDALQSGYLTYQI